ncbi:MAG TPA: hypothetical protein VHY75_10960 [Steroidobacteraceae bacterium]|nr:hypothetical protein [Steroidobacteraceae bacterium]
MLVVCLLYGGFVRAAHIHKLEAMEQRTQHLECLLCMDANHLAVPPAMLPPPVFHLAWFIMMAGAVLRANPRVTSLFYDARGPPHA